MRHDREKRERKVQPKCDICGEVSSKLFCMMCARRYNIRDKKCSQCRFYKEGVCEITKKEVRENYYCFFFYTGRKDV